ncbi:Membrane associated eicosanoid/glutathione metabolism-like protein [Gracilaria domingensis]|nr:Membrane associated eicosanoid/glutathione metabolism-like protein [Gracilaria domingensis]
MAFSWPAFSVILAGILAYIPHGIRVSLVMKNGRFDNSAPRDHEGQKSSLPEEKREFMLRLLGCHNNQMESLGVYAAGVAANLAFGDSKTLLNVFTALYIVFRVIYLIVYSLPQYAGGYLRTAAFVGCLAMIISIWSNAAF